MNYIHSKNALPASTHYAAIVFSSVYHESDERSRTAPGHGYPAHSEDVCQYIAFRDKDDMEQWVRKEEGSGHPCSYRVIECNPLSVIKTVAVQVA